MSGSTIDVRRITQDEIPPWRKTRLRALQDHPDVFGTEYDETRERGTGYLIERGFGDDADVNALLAAWGEDGSVLGTSGVCSNTGMRFHIAEIWDLHTVPEARGQGIARRLVGAAIAHCRSVQQVRQVQVSVNASNSPALGIFEATGFT